MALREVLLSQENRNAVVRDCAALIDQEVASKGGLSGLALKAGYAAVKGIKPGFVDHAIGELLPEFADRIDPFWEEGKRAGRPRDHIVQNGSKVADALLGVTDEKAKLAKSNMVRATYEKLRPAAKRNVEDALPRLAALLEKHA